MDEYAVTVRKFYQALHEARKKYNLFVNSRLSTNRSNYVKIYQARTGMPQKLVIKVEEEDEILCYRKATEELENWYQNRLQMEKQKKEVG